MQTQESVKSQEKDQTEQTQQIIDTTISASLNSQNAGKNYRVLQLKYEGFETSLKQDKNSEYAKILSSINLEIEDILTERNTDYQHIFMLVSNFLPKYFKLILSRRYHMSEQSTQILVTKFVNNWLRMRVPLLYQFFIQTQDNSANESKDPLIRCYGFQKEFEIIEMIFDDNLDIYNHRFSKNNSETEESLYRIKEELINQEIDKQTNNMEIDSTQGFSEEVSFVVKPQSTSYFYVHNINMFSKYKGFDQLLKIMQFANNQTSESHNQVKRPMLKFMAMILNMMTSMRQTFRDQFWSAYMPQMRDLIHDYVINRCSSEDLRTINKKDMTYFINQMESMLDSNPMKQEDRIEKVFKISETMELHLARICLQMPVLEKKLIGHNILINKIFQARNSSNAQQNSQANQVNINSRWINVEKLIEWLDNEKIFDLVFGDSLHSEVIKKSYPLLQFLYQNDRIREKELDKIWECGTKKHEAYKVAILKALTFIATKASLKDLTYIFKKVKSLQMSELDKFSLQLVKVISKKLAGEEDKRYSSQIQGGGSKNTGLVRSNSMTKANGLSRADEFRQKIARNRNSNEDLVKFEDDVIQLGSSNRLIDQGFPKDDLTAQIMQQKKKQGKRTRSFSGGAEDRNIKLDLQSSQRKSNNQNLQKEQIIQSSSALQNQNNTRAQVPDRFFEEIKRNDDSLNPLEVPPDKEDKKTADEEGSFGDRDDFAGQEQNDFSNNLMDDIFDYQNRDFQQNQAERSQPQRNQNHQRDQSNLEEEKGDGALGENQEQMQLNIRLMITDTTLGIEVEENRELAQQVLEYLWHLCLEETVLQNNLSLQTHKMSIECFVEILSQNYQKAILPYIGKCISCLHHNFSVMSVQTLMQKLIMKIQFPLQQGKVLPKNRQELIQYIDEELNIANICLGSYIEFKRISLSLIMDQLGSQEQEQENLETQSSLDNEDEKTSFQSVHKNSGNLATNQNVINIQDHAQLSQQDQQMATQEDQTNQSSGSLFISPRGKPEEEFKVPISHKTQSYQGDNLLQQNYQRNTDFSQLAGKNQESSDDWFQKNSQGVGLVQTGSQTVGNRHFNSQKKVPQSQPSRVTDMTPNNQMVQIRENANQIEQNQQPPTQNSNNNNNRDFLNTLITNEVYRFSYYQDMQHRLDFLKFYFGQCPQILKPQQIQIVWECLVINAFYDKERDQFFNWCTQILKQALNLPGARDVENIGGASIFKDDCLEMLFFDTLLKLDFRFITETMYECFERFFIYINEQYGQIITNTAFETAFEVYETKLIGVEALWEITLCARNNRVYEKSAEFLHKLYKKMSPSLVDRLNEIKEDLLQTCMDQIKCGLNEIKQEAGNDIYDAPIYQFSDSVEDPKNRIARSISQLCKFIDEFEGLRERGAKSSLGGQDKEIFVICNNQINSSQGPKKINLTLPLSTKIGEIREQVANSIFPKRQAKEICLTYKGKDQNEDLKSLKELGLKPEDQQAIFFVTLRNQYELEAQNQIEDYGNQEMLDNMVQTLREFGLDLPTPILQLAIQKCNLQLEEALLMLTEEDKVNDLQEELRKKEENSNQIVILQQEQPEQIEKEEAKLNLILSNRSEYFDLLFDLLNLGINEITNASWNLLIQIPVNKQLLNNIRNLSIVQQGLSENWGQIIDSSNVYKMLYSLQIVNSFISVNNEKLSESEIQERYEWRERFLELGGFDHLYSILITLDLDEAFGFQNQAQRRTAQNGKKKTKGLNNKAKAVQESDQDIKNREQIQNNSAKCLGYLISIIKIFIQAALLTSDEENLLTLIVQSSTSPFRKPKTIKSALQSLPPNKFNQMLLNAGGTGSAGGSVQDFSINEGHSRDNSSVNTPKFHSNHSSNNITPDCNTPIEPQNEKGNQQMNKSVDTLKFELNSQQTFSKANQDQLYTQVDDFPRLVDQMNGGIAKNLLEKVVNFNALISKLLYLIFKSTQFCESKEVSSLVQNSLDLLLPCVVWRPNQLLKEIYEFEHLESLLINTLMFSQNENVRKSLERTFKIICSDGIIQGKALNQPQKEFQEDSKTQLQVESPKIYILKILLKNMPDVHQKSDHCEEYFNLLTQLIRQCHSNFQLVPRVNQEINQSKEVQKQKILIDDVTFSSIDLLEWSIAQLKNRPTYEDKYSNYSDKILGGYLQLTQSVLEIDQQLKLLTVNDENGYNLVKTIFDFLFLLPSVEEQQKKHKTSSESISANDYPKCKRKFTRKKAFNLLLTLSHQCKPNYIQLLEELYKFHAQIKKSEKVVNIQDLDLEQGMRSASGYVGLLNFTATCYMNSLIQQLFMIPDLRQGILRAPIYDDDLEQNVLYQLKQTFANLQESEKQYYAPQGFTNAFKFYGEPVNVRVQQDTHEFYNILCENIEESMKGTPVSNLLKDTVGGVIGNETKSLEPEFPYNGEREENFFAISLDIKNKKNLAEALDLYIKPDFLEGDNKYLCDKYNTKINAQRRSYLKKLSNTVIINLKRFDFDFNTMMRQKVNDYCEFPTRINFKPWTKEGIREREKELARQQRNSNGGENISNLNNPMDEVLDEESKAQSRQRDSNSGNDQNAAAGDEIDQEDMNSDDNQSSISDLDIDQEDKKGGEALDEDMESVDDENDQNVNTGAYFDEDIIDIAVDDDESQSNQTKQNEAKQNSAKNKKLIEKQKSSGKQKSRKRLQSKDESYYEYEVVGVLVHSGSAEGGHYYSYIKERDGQKRWLRFDDKNVTVFDEARLGAECFGGQNDMRGGNNQPAFLDDFGGDGRFSFERSANAYLLFYQRINPYEAQVQEESQMNQIAQQNLQELRYINNIEEQIYQKIWEQNGAFLKLKVFFDQEYFQFIREYVNIYNFENVLYFSKENSQSYYIKKMIELSQQYDKDQKQGGNLSVDYKSKQREIENEIKNSSDCNIFSEMDKIREDPGLYTLKLATVLSQDIITKVKDVQNFVQWMQLINHLFERHELACVWFVKYMNENRKILEELLLENQMFEVRESFSNLLKTAISITAKNEESYFEEHHVYYDFDCDAQLIKEGQVEMIRTSKASTVRLMNLLFNQMLDQVRVHWRRFDEYFQVIYHFIQTNFLEVKYMIESRAILKLIEFMANNNPPFLQNIKFKMGDRGQDPDFSIVLDILGYLVKCSITQGITNISQYSQISVYQKESQHLQLGQEEMKYLLSGYLFNCRIINKQTSVNRGMISIVEHLSWGDFAASKFYINEILEHIRTIAHRNCDECPNLLEYFSKVLLIKDELQNQRLREAFKFDGLSMGSNTFGFLESIKQNYSIFTLNMLKYFGNLALQDQEIMKYLQEYISLFKKWVVNFLTSNIVNHKGQVDEQFNFKRLQEMPDLQRAYSQIFMDENIFKLVQESNVPSNDIQSSSNQLNTLLHNDSFDFGENHHDNQQYDFNQDTEMKNEADLNVGQSNGQGLDDAVIVDQDDLLNQAFNNKDEIFNGDDFGDIDVELNAGAQFGKNEDAINFNNNQKKPWDLE